jgi:hypothetical protein
MVAVETVFTVKGIFDGLIRFGCEVSPAGIKGVGRGYRRQARALPRTPSGYGACPPSASNRVLHAIDTLMWLNSPSVWPDQKVCLFSGPRSITPTACASQPRESAWV